MLDGRQNAAGLTGELLETGLFRSGLKINHLRLILAIDDHRRISAAADLLGISQPAASRMLAEIEAIVKAPICERVARGVELTRYGEALARRARTIFLELREAAREINELKTGSGGSVSLGSVTGPGLNLAVPAIRQVSTAYPGIEINVQIDNSNVLTRELLAARHDFIVGRIPDDLNPRLFNPLKSVSRRSASSSGRATRCWTRRQPAPTTSRPTTGCSSRPVHCFDARSKTVSLPPASGFRQRSSILHRPS